MGTPAASAALHGFGLTDVVDRMSADECYAILETREDLFGTAHLRRFGIFSR
jgi:hypothetical protein